MEKALATLIVASCVVGFLIAFHAPAGPTKLGQFVEDCNNRGGVPLVATSGEAYCNGL